MKRAFIVVLLLPALLLPSGCKVSINNGAAPSSSSQPQQPPNPQVAATASPTPTWYVPGPAVDANPTINSADAVPQGLQECVMNLHPPRTGISMKDSLNIQAQVMVLCNELPKLLFVTLRLELQNSKGQWDDEADILLDPFLPTPVRVNGVELLGRVYGTWTPCYPGWWRIEVSWSGVGAQNQPVGTDNVPAAPTRTNCDYPETQ